jgi:hypothetical protein
MEPGKSIQVQSTVMSLRLTPKGDVEGPTLLDDSAARFPLTAAKRSSRRLRRAMTP